MCGISGIVGMEGRSYLEEMVRVQSHRGPDDSGIEYLSEFPPVAFGHNRLSILDLSVRGHQPMLNRPRTVCITYNGEIYNFRELREELKSYGYPFLSETDTEVVLHAYDCWGLKCFERFNGMFALAIFDRLRNRVILARDRMGVKPLYYWLKNERLVFASEIKALLTLPQIRRGLSLDKKALCSYASRLWAPGEMTPFDAIKRLLPGTYLEFNLGDRQGKVLPYWSLKSRVRVIREAEEKETLRDLLEKAVLRQQVADVPVGAFLSGGLDSSAIVRLMANKNKTPVQAFTISFAKEDQALEAMMDDFRYANELAKTGNIELHKVEIDAVGAASLLSKIVYQLDEPIGDPAAINTFLIAQTARERGISVLLSGQGSDELFGGYRKYLACLWIERYQQIFPQALQHMLEGLLKKCKVAADGRGNRHIRWLKRALLHEGKDAFSIYDALSSFVTGEKLRELLHPDLAAIHRDEAHRKMFESVAGDYLMCMAETDTKLFLPDLNFNYSDKATMAASVECRVPFADAGLVDYAFSLPSSIKIKGGNQKYILKQALQGILPRSILNRPKMPFSSPIRSWMKKKEFRELMRDYLNPEYLNAQGYFQGKAVAKLMEQDQAGIEDNAHVLYGLLTIQMWLEAFSLK